MQTNQSADPERAFVDALWAQVERAKMDGDTVRLKELELEARQAELQLATRIPGLSH